MIDERLDYILKSKPSKNDKEVYKEGIFSLIEYEDVNYCRHEFMKGDEYLSDLEVLQLLNMLHEENQLLIEDTEKHRKLAIQFDNRNKELVSENALLEKENEQLKSTIAQLIEQNSKNNDLLLSDIRILEKALWCSGCENDFERLRELRKEFMG